MRNMDDIDDEVDEGISEIDDVGIEELNDVSLTDLRWFRDALFIRISVNPTILFFKDYNNTDDPPDDDPPVDDQTDQWPHCDDWNWRIWSPKENWRHDQRYILKSVSLHVNTSLLKF